MHKFLFFPHVPYHVTTFFSVINELNSCDVSIVYADHLKHYGSKKIKESIIKKMADEKNIRAIPYTPQLLWKEKPDVLVVMNDWGGWPKRAVEDAKKMRILTVGHMEGPEDYYDTHLDDGYPGEKRPLYKKVDYVFLLGKYDEQYCKNLKTVLIGSPRFDNFFNYSINRSKSKEKLVGINCNFSYGLYADVANRWIDDVISVVKSKYFNYQISQHIGDNTNLKGLNVYTGSLYELIEESTVFISRFSTAIIESLLMGIPVIYYNPHKEDQDTYLNPMGAFPKPTNKKELGDAIDDILGNKSKWLAGAENFLDSHIANRDGKSAKIFAKELIEIAKKKGTLDPYFPIRSHIKYIIESITRKFK